MDRYVESTHRNDELDETAVPAVRTQATGAVATTPPIIIAQSEPEQPDTGRSLRFSFLEEAATSQPVTSEELQRQGYSRAEADRIAARRNADANLRRSFLRFFRIWTSMFFLLSIATIVCFFFLLFEYAEHRSLGCAFSLRWWSEVLFFMIIYSFFFHRFVVRRLCCYNPEAEEERPAVLPLRVKLLMLFRTLCSTGWCILGLVLSTQHNDCGEHLRPKERYNAFAHSAFYFSIFYLVLNLHFGLLFTAPYFLLRYAQSRGWLRGPEAAPKGTAAKLQTVDVEKDAKFKEIVEDGCSVCLEEFVSKQAVIKQTHCGHYFHVQCLDNWLQVSRCCPLCRFDVVDGLTPESPKKSGVEEP